MPRPPRRPTGRLWPDPGILKVWETRIRARDPQTVCFWAVSLERQRRVLPAIALASGDHQADCPRLARELAPPLVGAALKKLAGQFPKEAKKGGRQLIRWHAEEAYRVCAQAVEWAPELPAADCRAYNGLTFWSLWCGHGCYL
jgi:hypothetical protein